MKRLVLVLSLICLLALGGQAFAELCTIDAVPAATLLLPYFEVDLSAAPGEGVNTIFSINNASAAPALAHVSVWTDWTQPVVDFDVFLTGYDVQSVNLYDVFVNGNLPVTADEQSDQGQDNGRIADPTSSCTGSADSCSPHGDNPSWDGSFPDNGSAGAVDCLSIFPFFVNPLLTGTRLADIQAKLTGEPIGGNCFGASYGDNRARGYILIDNAQSCSLIFQDDPAYFPAVGGGVAIASTVNQLWGDYFFIDPVNAFAQGDNLVHIEADDAFVGRDNDYTFYRRYSQPPGTEDSREPLGTTWASRYLNGGLFDGGTTLTVWRDSTSAEIAGGGYTCGAPGVAGAGPSWHPLNETQVVAFNEREDAEALCGFLEEGDIISPPDPFFEEITCFPLETQRVPLGVGDLALTYNFGWIYLNLNVGVDSVNDDYDPDNNEELAQSYVSVTHDALATFSVGYPAIALTSACSNDNPTLSF